MSVQEEHDARDEALGCPQCSFIAPSRMCLSMLRVEAGHIDGMRASDRARKLVGQLLEQARAGVAREVQEVWTTQAIVDAIMDDRAVTVFALRRYCTQLQGLCP